MSTLAHLSDLHTTSLRGAPAAALASKRFLGWLSWSTRRRHEYRGEVLARCVDDVRAARPDHVVVTGDLTNVALPQEFDAVSAWLAELGTPEWVSIIPGNHDAYVSVPPRDGWDKWAAYLCSDAAAAERAPHEAEFPTLRVRDELAIVGLCSAEVTAPFVASGRVGAPQLQRLEQLLSELRDRDLCRVVLVHHPVVDGDISQRRCLRDSAALREVLTRCGAELVLHGHLHRTAVHALDGPEGVVPIVGVRSPAYAGEKPEKCAQYHLYRIERAAAGSQRFHITLETRAYAGAEDRFVAAGVTELC